MKTTKLSINAPLFFVNVQDGIAKFISIRNGSNHTDENKHTIEFLYLRLQLIAHELKNGSFSNWTLTANATKSEIIAFLELQFRKGIFTFGFLNEQILNTQKKYNGIIFDLDNTLLDTNNLHPYIENLKQHPANKNKQANKEAWKLHDAHVCECKMYDGMQDVFDFITKHNIKSSIVSNSVKQRILKCAETFNFPIREELMFGRYSVIPRVAITKPDKRLFLKALEAMDVPPESVISFGNCANDIILAHNASVDSVACRWGATDEEWDEMLQANPTYSIEHPREILKFIQ